MLLKEIQNQWIKDIAVFLGFDNSNAIEFEKGCISIESFFYDALTVLLSVLEGWLFHQTVYALLIIMLFSLLHQFSGGYHAKTHAQCIDLWMIFFTVCQLYIKFIHWPLADMMLTILNSALIYRYAPLVNPLQANDVSEIRKNRLSALYLCTVYDIAFLACFHMSRRFSVSIACALTLCGILLAGGKES